jgi:hypothetical protein
MSNLVNDQIVDQVIMEVTAMSDLEVLERIGRKHACPIDASCDINEQMDEYRDTLMHMIYEDYMNE